jgi:hypothetical protein
MSHPENKKRRDLDKDEYEEQLSKVNKKLKYLNSKLQEIYNIEMAYDITQNELEYRKIRKSVIKKIRYNINKLKDASNGCEKRFDARTTWLRRAESAIYEYMYNHTRATEEKHMEESE